MELLDAAVACGTVDLVLLVGDAASDGGSSVLKPFRTRRPTARSFPSRFSRMIRRSASGYERFGTAPRPVIARSASVDAIADRVAKLAREIPDRDGGIADTFGEATLDELVQALSKELRSATWSIRTPKGAEDARTIRVVEKRQCRPLAQTIDEFVSRLRKHVVHAEPSASTSSTNARAARFRYSERTRSTSSPGGRRGSRVSACCSPTKTPAAAPTLAAQSLRG